MGNYINKNKDLSSPQKMTINKTINPFTNKDIEEVFAFEYDFKPFISKEKRKSIIVLTKRFPNALECFKTVDSLYNFILKLAYQTYFEEISYIPNKKAFIKELINTLKKGKNDKYSFFNNSNINDYKFEDRFIFLVEAQYKNNFHNLFNTPDKNNTDETYIRFTTISNELKTVITNISKLHFIEFLEKEYKNSKEIKSFGCTLTKKALSNIFEELIKLKFISQNKNDVNEFINGLKTKNLTNDTIILNWTNKKYTFVMFMDKLKRHCNGINKDYDYCQGHFLIKDQKPTEKSIVDARNIAKKQIKIERSLNPKTYKHYTETQTKIRDIFK